MNAPPLDEPAPLGWMETGIHGVPRQRQWDAVVTVEVEGIEGDAVHFVALPDDILLVDEDVDAEPLAAALDDAAQPPYRAEAVRRGETQWAVGIRRIEVVDLGDDAPDGEELTLTVREGETGSSSTAAQGSARSRRSSGSAQARSTNYVVQGHRLDGTLWEIRVTPL